MNSISRISRILIVFFGLALLFSTCKKANELTDESRYSGDLFTENIRSTEPQTAEQERLGFKLPPGFEIQLFASEPDIDKPINMTFDAKGRMWVTQSFEYPFPTTPGKKSTDRLTILEDTDHDGKADRFTEVADTLNIPIGVLPTRDGVVAFSVPNVYKFIDANQDGKPESKSKMFGPFGFQDTHGMVSNFVRGYDGWVYACHGFTNLSAIAGADGDSIKMVSGNTFRFRLDGSRVEQMTFGQVNPFGLAYDENGYVYSTDSHSSPLHQLIRGGDYPHFSKLEIMAFGPDMKSFEEEATALCGIAYYGDTKFPKEFQGNFFIGDAVSSRVHRYSWENKGSSPVGKSEVDLVKSADPWFRPVNIKLGPDGALYIADFYNAIIGHYEVPLGHPKRDKQRGRIWRITYKGEHNDPKDLTTANLNELLSAFDANNITTRMAAADQLADRVGEPAVEALKVVVNDQANTTPQKYVHSLWVLYRLNALDEGILKKSLAHSSPLVRLHTLRILKEWKSSQAEFQPLILNSLKDSDPHVQRAAVELLMDYHDMSSVEAALSVLHTAPAFDTHLIYTSRLALRNLLRDNALMKQVAAKKWSTEESGFIAGTLVDVNSEDAALFLSNYVASNSMPKGKTQLAYQQILRFIPQKQIDKTIKNARDKQANDIELKASIFRGVKEGLAQRGVTEKNQLLAPWGTEIALGLLKKYPSLDTLSSEEITSQQSYAIQLAGDYKVQTLEPDLKIFLAQNPNAELKTSALRSLLKMATDNSSFELAKTLLLSDNTPINLKKNVAAVLGESPGKATNTLLREIKKAPADLEAVIATALANSPEGKQIVLDQVRNGSYLSRTLIDPRVEERMLQNISSKQQKEYNYLTANIEPLSVERQALIDKRIKAFKTFKASTIQLDSGAMVFGNNCSVCHRKLTMSGIGPQLHGIGKRGVEAIAEKIIDPNRNISEAFRNYTITLKDGNVMTGLYRRDQGAVIVFGDLSGKEFSIPKKDIVEQKPSRYTIMPDHFGSTLSQQEFNVLITYLLTW
ncbi:MAG: HEAT repeat domain-containing protein [Cyclobacteriaceae bacterium]|nr:HEAT repeat domain-containing protein [Cyclobacteriaceae bacterium]